MNSEATLDASAGVHHLQRRRPGRRRPRDHPPLWRGRLGRRRPARRLARGRQRPPHRGHGLLGLRQVDAHAHPRRPRQADDRLGHRQGRGDLDDERQGAHAPAPQAHRLHLPGLQPPPGPVRGGEHRAAAADRRASSPTRLRRAGPRARRSARPAHAPALRAVRRPAAARGDRPRARHRADRAVRRRADRQPRLAHRHRGPRAAARRGRLERPDDGHGHPRRAAAATADRVLFLNDGSIVPTSPSPTRPRSSRR